MLSDERIRVELETLGLQMQCRVLPRDYWNVALAWIAEKDVAKSASQERASRNDNRKATFVAIMATASAVAAIVSVVLMIAFHKYPC